ncbi:MAG: hypothetical protein WKF84_27400 [Pyrinomonadaceae bacterium]
MTPGEDSSRAKKIAHTRDGNRSNGVSWTPDGKIVYTLVSGENTNIWVVSQDGTDPKQLTFSTNRVNVRGSVSPDGRYILYVSDQAGPAQHLEGGHRWQ